MKRKTIIFAGLVLFLLVSCEPNDWNLILDGIDDVTNLSVTHPSAQNAAFSYNLPEYPLYDFRDNDRDYDIYFYYSPAGSNIKTYIGARRYDNPTEGDTGNETIDMTSYVLTGGSQYTFTVFTIDENYKPSNGVSQTITW